ncbi:hypothetical protein FNH22_24610 [Fulvivirga sp. M361]|uniref:hypothetical protein n=1 Tax=Fulvivirga sp. M361 TaxID=2594266 RepID=UPI001179E5F1|nr:hypothetical protein [Fulvivirga sp. M361]TRX51179.1 hypothetical protein FNH22_24610 [Fulvivirga sp. M361]
MRYLIYTISFMLLTGVQFSCNEIEKEFELPPPSITVKDPLPDPVIQEAGNDIFQIFTLQSAVGLLKFDVFQDDVLVETINYTDEISDVYSFNYTIPQGTPNKTRTEFKFILTDADGVQVEDEIQLLVNTTFLESIETINNMEVTVLKGRLNRDYTIEAVRNYLIDSTLSVENNGIFTIEAGATVHFRTYDNQIETSRLVITQGAKIIAEGTPDAPIVFTSDKLLTNGTPMPFDWGGLVIHGNAPSNRGGVLLNDGFRYGGDVPNDNSGILRYIRIEYAGNLQETTVHALRLLGVGSGTRIDHVQTYRNYNIAFRLIGGRVNLKYISGMGHGGYGLWASEGWQGLGQFWLFQTDVAATILPVNYWNIARSIEMRNDDDNFLREPRTSFTISNVTCIGNGFQEGVDNGTRRGVRFRRGAIGTFQNAIITGFPNDAARVEDLDISVLGVDMIFDNVRSFDNSKNYEQEARTVFFESGNFNVTEDPVPGISLSSFVGSETSPFDPATLGSFFTSAPYIGAVQGISNDWTTEGEWFKDLDGSIR